ncbi:MAG: hypothetical protein MI919_10170, partial [Holophagales bacterium]|nr:hypothetical protein [Holophagales bacterium]
VPVPQARARQSRRTPPGFLAASAATPPPPSRLRPSLSAELDRLVLGLLDRAPERRAAHAASVLSA